MGILRADRVSGLGGANAINGSVFFGRNGTTAVASGNWLTAYSADDFSFGTGDFTIEYWFYFTGVSGSNSGSFQISNTEGGLNNANGASTGGLALNYENGCVKGIGNNGWFNGSNSVSVGTWNHAAFVRHSGTLQIFTNGAADTSASDSQNYSLTHLAIGGYYSTSHLFQGYISDFRIVKGTAVYTTDFTPPTEKLTAVDGTVLLCCQDSDDATQEATGKTITGYGRYTNTDTELVTNHSFNNGTTGWTLSDANEGSMAVVNGSLVLTNDDSSDPPVYAWQAVTLVVGQTYDLKVHFSGGTNSPGSNLAVYLHTSSSFGSSAGGSMTADSISGNGIKIHRFTATVATTYLLLRVNANAAGTSIFSAASIKASDPGKAPKVLPPVGVDDGVVFDGDTKVNTQGYMYFPTGDTSQRGRGRGLFAGGAFDASTSPANIAYIDVPSSGNTTTFGELTQSSRCWIKGMGSSTRAIFAVGCGSPGSPIQM